METDAGPIHALEAAPPSFRALEVVRAGPALGHDGSARRGPGNRYRNETAQSVRASVVLLAFLAEARRRTACAPNAREPTATLTCPPSAGCACLQRGNAYGVGHQRFECDRISAPDAYEIAGTIPIAWLAETRRRSAGSRQVVDHAHTNERLRAREAVEARGADPGERSADSGRKVAAGRRGTTRSRLAARAERPGLSRADAVSARQASRTVRRRLACLAARREREAAVTPEAELAAVAVLVVGTRAARLHRVAAHAHHAPQAQRAQVRARGAWARW